MDVHFTIGVTKATNCILASRLPFLKNFLRHQDARDNNSIVKRWQEMTSACHLLFYIRAKKKQNGSQEINLKVI